MLVTWLKEQFLSTGTCSFQIYKCTDVLCPVMLSDEPVACLHNHKNNNTLTTTQLNLVSPFSRKYFPLTATGILSSHMKVIIKSSVHYITLSNIQYHTRKLKYICPYWPCPGLLSKTVLSRMFYVFFKYCIALVILYYAAHSF